MKLLRTDTHRPRVLARALAGLSLLFAVGCGSCKDAPPEAKKRAEVVVDAGPPDEPLPYMTVRQAYGAPVPPEVVYIKETYDFIEVGTKLRLRELRGFFEERLVDYEFIERDNHSLRLVGLRSGMPTIWIEEGLSTLPVKVMYVKDARGGAGEKPEHEPEPLVSERKRGEPVNDRLPNGELVAPGARWGEPYVPPEGSPLNQPRFRANFGKPYGTWSPN